MVQHFEKHSGSSLNGQIQLWYEPASPLLGTGPKEMNCMFTQTLTYQYL